MPKVVKHVRADLEFLDRAAETFIRGKENAPEDTLLGFDGVRWQAVNGGRISEAGGAARAEVFGFGAVARLGVDGSNHKLIEARPCKSGLREAENIMTRQYWVILCWTPSVHMLLGCYSLFSMWLFTMVQKEETGCMRQIFVSFRKFSYVS